MCCVRLSGETEAKRVAFHNPLTPLSGGVPIRSYNKQACCSLGLSDVQQHLMEPPAGMCVFQTPIRKWSQEKLLGVNN